MQKCTLSDKYFSSINERLNCFSPLFAKLGTLNLSGQSQCLLNIIYRNSFLALVIYFFYVLNTALNSLQQSSLPDGTTQTWTNSQYCINFRCNKGICKLHEIPLRLGNSLGHHIPYYLNFQIRELPHCRANQTDLSSCLC